MSDNIRRSGVIPYSVTESGRLIFMLGLDYQSQEISDWSGKVCKLDRDVYHTASRELQEESLNCVMFSPSLIQKGVSVDKDGIMTTFVKIELKELLDYFGQFSRRYARRDKSITEMCGVKYLFENDIVKCIDNGKMYKVVADVIRDTFPEILKTLRAG